MHQIFISYSSKDSAGTEKVCRAVEEAGYKCWIAPRDVTPGRDYAEEIINAIENCALMVLVLSANSNMSAHIKREVEHAVNQGKTVIPFFIEKMELSKSLKYFLNVHHWLDASEPPMEKHLEKLVETARAILTVVVRDPAAPSAPVATARAPREKEQAAPATVLSLPPDEFLSRWGLADVEPGELGMRLIQEVITKAIVARASDIHLDLARTKADLRLRINGVVTQLDAMPEGHYRTMMGHVRATCRMSEASMPQDGRMSLDTDHGEQDVVISILPTTGGESVAIRMIVSLEEKEFDQKQYGFSDHDMSLIRELTGRPNGMILVTGPSGSGKTRVLYGLLALFEPLKHKIVTIEDRVFYKVPGVIHAEIDPAKNMTYSTMFQALLKQDAEVIMCGGIPDPQFAEMVLKACSDGKLVVIQTDAPTATAAIQQLCYQRIDRYLIGRGISGVTCQRLLKKICPDCREQVAVPGEELQKHGLQASAGPFYRGRGCDACNGTGYRGREGVFEVFLMQDEMRGMIADGAPAEAIRKLAREKYGMITLRQDAIAKALEGIVTFEEAVSKTPNELAVENVSRMEEKPANLRERDYTDPGTGLEMVFVEGGSFLMGRLNEQECEKPVHKVILSDFSLSKYPVTVAQYRRYCKAAGKEMPPPPDWGWADEHPVVGIAWNEALGYCQWAGLRLPTEAEWEYAAIGGNKSQGYKYSGGNELEKLGWYKDNSGGQTRPVGKKQPNELGLYDMSGNVWEWCQDIYDDKYYSRSPEKDPPGPANGNHRVLRGGSWLGKAGFCRTANRRGSPPDLCFSSTGFRPAK